MSSFNYKHQKYIYSCGESELDSTISGPLSASYTRLITIIAKQLSNYTSIDCSVHEISGYNY